MRMKWIATVSIGLAALLGCQKPVHFPATSLSEQAKAAGAFAAFDASGHGRANCFFFANEAGRIDRIGYDLNGDQKPESIVRLDELPASQCRHLVIVLDGFGYHVVKEYYDQGGLRFCHPPSLVIAPYPTLTDPCIEDLLNYMPCAGFEALYYDAAANKLVGGSMAYVAGKNEPYNRLLQYRASLIWDAIGYLYPWPVFGKEINDAKRVFDRASSQEVIAYFVSSAGVGTQMGAEGQKKCLQEVDRLINQVMWETHGLTKITITADHGHSYTPATRIPLEPYLEKKGWKLTDSLKGPRDVVYVRFGLETYASFAALRSAELAADLIGCEGVEIASYADDNSVVVLGRQGGKAIVRRKGDRYKYERVSGDPLKLSEPLAALKADGEGYYDAQELFEATARHEYPCPLERLWRGHFGLAENPPTVIVSLEDRFYSGSGSFAGAVRIASTHGGLNYRNSATFIMSTAGALRPVMRSRDVPGNLEKLLKVDRFPQGK